MGSAEKGSWLNYVHVCPPSLHREFGEVAALETYVHGLSLAVKIQTPTRSVCSLYPRTLQSSRHPPQMTAFFPSALGSDLRNLLPRPH